MKQAVQILLVLSLLVSHSVGAELIEELELKTCIPGACGEVVAAGDLIYCATTSGLLILDGTDPRHPGKVSFHPVPGDGGAVALQGNYAYFTSGYYSEVQGPGGLTIIDISDPARPLTVGNCDTPRHPRKVAVGGDHAYVGDSGGLRIIDIGDSANPVEVVFLPIWNQDIHLQLVGSLLFCSFDFSGLRIFDVSNPLAPIEIGSYGGLGNVRDLTVRGDYAYLTGGGRGIHIIDVSDPIEPFLVGDCDLDFDIHFGTAAGDIALLGDYAYVTIGSYGVAIADVSDPTAPFELVYHEVRGAANDIVIQGDLIYLSASYGGICILEIEEPATLIDLGQYQLSGYVNDIEIDDGILYVNGGYVPEDELRASGERSYFSWAGLYLFDIEDPARPAYTGFATTYYPNPNQVEVAANIAYITSAWNGLRMLNVEDPFAPYELAPYVANMNEPDNIHVQGTLAYLSGHFGFTILDISTPGAPVQVGNFVPSTVIKHFCVLGDYVYATSYALSLMVIDVGDPSDPHLAATCDIGQHGESLQAVGDELYVADRLHGLIRVDISDPLNPVRIGSLPMEQGYPEAMDVEDGYVYVTGGFGYGLRVIDVSDPLEMREVAHSNLPDEGLFIEVDDRLICIGDAFTGVWIFEHAATTAIEPEAETPAIHALGQNFPNPFNPVTTINYDLHHGSTVTLEVFDVTGRLVKTLVDGVVPAGRHGVEWDGTDRRNRQVGSGLYLYRLRTDSYTETKSMVLMK
ncbi:MAG: T9SS type A sorting domain-containing protein [bacterium]|nr:T9SS type A sorting domain-containing protein [bacterium]